MSLFNTPFDSLLISGGGGNNDVPVEAHYILSPANLYVDRAGTINVTAQDDFVGNISDSSGNANTLVAPTDAARALAKTDGTNWWVKLDKVDDNYSTTFANPITGTMLIGTRKGTIQIEVDIPSGVWKLTPNPAYFPGDTITDIIIYNGVLTDAQVSNALTWFEGRGSPRVYTPTGTDLVNGFRGWGILKSVIKNADLSNVTSVETAFFTNKLTTIPAGLFDNSTNLTFLSSAFRDNLITALPSGLFDFTPLANDFRFTFNINQITSIPAGLFDFTVNVTSFRYTFDSNPLTDAPAGLFDNQLVCTNYTSCFTNTALTQASIDNVLVSINVSATNNNLLNGGFNQSGGSAPSVTGQAAIDSLRAKGWTITVTGGY